MTTPTLALYPDPGDLSHPPTWEDIERLSLVHPAVRAYVMLARRGDITREQALIAMTFYLAQSFAAMYRREIDRLNEA